MHRYEPVGLCISVSVYGYYSVLVIKDGYKSCWTEGTEYPYVCGVEYPSSRSKTLAVLVLDAPNTQAMAPSYGYISPTRI